MTIRRGCVILKIKGWSYLWDIEADSLQEELEKARETIQELQENLAEANHEFDIDRCNL